MKTKKGKPVKIPKRLLGNGMFDMSNVESDLRMMNDLWMDRLILELNKLRKKKR